MGSLSETSRCIACVLVAPPPRPAAPVFVDPCVPSPCGPNSQCRDIGGAPSCSCLANYMGVPPNCRPECSINPECPSNRACMREKCRDPCPGSCGAGAQCNVINHTPVCTCPEGYTGDPFTNCFPRPPPRKQRSFCRVEPVVESMMHHLLSDSQSSVRHNDETQQEFTH